MKCTKCKGTGQLPQIIPIWAGRRPVSLEVEVVDSGFPYNEQGQEFADWLHSNCMGTFIMGVLERLKEIYELPSAESVPGVGLGPTQG